MIRAAGLVVLAGLLVACGEGAPGGFPAQESRATTQPAPAASRTSRAVTTTTDLREVTVPVSLARGTITPSPREVKARKVIFVVTNDDDVARSMRVATGGGAALLGIDPIAPDAIETLAVELAPGRYQLIADGGGKPLASAEFTVTGD